MLGNGTRSVTSIRHRYTWSNFTGRYVTQPLKYYVPNDLSELRDAMADSLAKGCRIRAIGSGHSWSDIATTPDALIDTRRLNRVLGLERDILVLTCNQETLFRTECGIVIRDLIRESAKLGLALPNMGGYDGQTIVGASQTATHGSGINLPPLCDFIVSLDMLTSHNELLRIEPRQGITDAALFAEKYPDRRLIQDDDYFSAVSVGLGCLGVIYSAYTRLVPYYWLRENRLMAPWSDVKTRVYERLASHRHYEIDVNPHSTNGQNTCIETMRDFSERPSLPWFLRSHRSLFPYFFASLPGATQLFAFLFRQFPSLSPRLIDWALSQYPDRDYVDDYNVVLPIGTLNNIISYSSEHALPVSSCVQAIDMILEMAARSSKDFIYHSAPVAVRFVRKTNAYLAMQNAASQEEDFCMIEFPVVIGTVGGLEQLERYERALAKLGARPHWGQVNYLSGYDLSALYPKLQAWLRIFDELNADGMFDSDFTDRLGFSTRSARKDRQC